MLVKDLIKDLEKIIEDNRSLEDVMGEATIAIDVFKEISPGQGFYRYAGFQDRFPIKITYSGDGVYAMLSAFASDYPSQEQVWEENRKIREERDIIN